MLLLDHVGENNSKWFIDQAYYAGSQSASETTVNQRNPNKWIYGHGFGKGITPHGNEARIELAFGGIKKGSKYTFFYD